LNGNDTSRLVDGGGSDSNSNQTEEQKETNLTTNYPDKEIKEMTIKIIGGRTYYTRKDEAEAVRRKGDRIYYQAGLGYYIVRPRRRDPWDFFGL
jgi:hypothetical protein